MKIYLPLLFLLMPYIVQAQSANPFMNDANGRPLYMRTSYIAEGSPYFYDEYCFAEITSEKGTVYPNVKVKLDLSDRTVIYMTESGAEMIASTPIRQIKFMSLIYNGTAYAETTLAGIDAPFNTPEGKVYQVLEDGNAKLLKELLVSYKDNKRYGEATITRIFTKKEILLARFDNPVSLKKVEKNKASVIALFDSKQEAIKTYVEEQKLKCKTENDLVRVFKYYNSL